MLYRLAGHGTTEWLQDLNWGVFNKGSHISISFAIEI